MGKKCIKIELNVEWYYGRFYVVIIWEKILWIIYNFCKRIESSENGC